MHRTSSRTVRINPEVAAMIVQKCPELSHTTTLADLRSIAAEPAVRGKGKATLIDRRACP